MDPTGPALEGTSRLIPWLHRQLSTRRQLKRGGLVVEHEFVVRPPYTYAIPGKLSQTDRAGFMAQQAPPYVHLQHNLQGVIVGELPVRLELFNTGPLPILIGNIWADVLWRGIPKFATTVFERPAGGGQIDAVVLDLDEMEPSALLGHWEHGRLIPTDRLWWESRTLSIAPGETVPLRLACLSSRNHLRFRVVINYSIRGKKHQAEVPHGDSYWEVTAVPEEARTLEFTNLLVHEGTPGVLLNLPELEPIE